MEQIILRPTPKQQEAAKVASENLITLFGGAVRGGKSYWLLMLIFTYAIKYDKSRWAVIRASYSTLTATLIVTFNKLMSEGLGQYVKSFNQSTHVVTLVNGSQIIFFAESYDNDKELNRFRGLEVNGFGIDEINELQRDTLMKCIERAGSWQGSIGCPIKILATCNPANNWVKEDFYDRYRLNTLPKGWAYVPSKITDNPHISKDYIESLKLLPTYQYEVFVNGNWDISLKTGGEFYKCFDSDKHVGSTVYDPLKPLHISWDENVNPYLPCGIFQIHDKEIHQIDEVAGVNPNNTIKYVCNEIKRKFKGHESGMFIYGDATSQKDDVKIEKGHNLFTLIRQELEVFNPSLRVLKSNPSVVMRGNFINTALEKNFDDITIIIGKNCKETINDFTNTKEAEDGTKAKTKETNPATKISYQKNGHFTDLFDYFICSAFRSSYEKYQRGGQVFSSILSGHDTQEKTNRF
jgi:hypothetical protein